jgi:hypothetical protein
MKAKHLLIVGLTASSLAIGSAPALAASFLIDDFDIPVDPPANTPLSFNMVGQTGSQSYSGLDINRVVGGNRTVDYTLTGFSGITRPRSEAELVTGSGNFDGAFEIRNNPGTTSRSEILWDNLQATGQSNFLQLVGEDDQIAIELTQLSDGIPFRYTLMFSDGMNMYSTTQEFDFEGEEELTKSLFVIKDITAGGSIDLSMVNYVKLVIEGNPGFDLAVTQIRAFEVPEPSMILGLLALFGTGFVSLKRQHH